MTLPIPDPKIRGGRRSKYPTSPEIDEALRVAYAKGIVPGVTLKQLAGRFVRSKQWLKSRAQALGLAVVRVKPPDWGELELEALCELAHFHPRVIAENMDFGRWNRRFLADCLINPKPRPKNPVAKPKEQTP